MVQTELGAAIGMSQQQYSKYELGEHEMPIRVLVALADYYGVSTDYILGRTRGTTNLDALNEKIGADYTVGELVSDVLSLDRRGRAAVIEYVDLQKIKAREKKK